MKKILNSKLVIILEFHNTKNIFANGNTQNWSGEVFVVYDIKITVPLTYVISDLYGEPFAGSFYEK